MNIYANLLILYEFNTLTKKTTYVRVDIATCMTIIRQ